MIALTGATGFVGSQILKALLARGARVRVIVREPAKLDSALLHASSSLDIVTTQDLFAESKARLSDLLSGTETLVHAAWYAEPGKYLTAERNLDCLTGTIALAKAFATAGGKRFVGLGTCAEYDADAGMLRVDTPLKPNTLYAACKASTYLLLSQTLSAAGLAFAWCRLFYLFGEGEDARRLVPHLHRQLSQGQPVDLTSGRQIRDFLDVADAGRMIADIALSSREGAENICSGVPVTVRQLAEGIADVYGRRDLLRFGARPDNLFDPACVVGVCEEVQER
ncbi:NAD-dependent epimerase/dehydratase [Thiohalocapsa halophila]|uniref:NAD-dependent epimerase/dehydratase n=1 Tax=Thiohalocapsa halophila TaxID=69359 RepID=A0ABS1CK99_9GAMM|nr:NAD(P)-dependent oxidoreductase [Thiohalocapsa halophila]MBK1631884.1 NAD-dependent epimerase/dehydratase [Thiohalocapsa halophila]